jgi:signal transduction histidine kinase
MGTTGAVNERTDELVRDVNRDSLRQAALFVVALVSTPALVVLGHSPSEVPGSSTVVAFDALACLLAALGGLAVARSLTDDRSSGATWWLGLLFGTIGAVLAHCFVDFGIENAPLIHLRNPAVYLIGLSYAMVAVVVDRLVYGQRELRRKTREVAAQVETTERLQHLLVNADEEIRRSVAEALHGPVQARLLASEMRLASIRDDRTVSPATRAEVIEVLATLQLLRDHDVRRLSHLLHPLAIEVGLVAAIRMLIDQMESMYELDIELTVDDRIAQVDGPGRTGLPNAARLTLYRALEEAINNAHRHGGARAIAVALEHDADDIVRLRVRDDGRGLTNSHTHGFGLLAIASRAKVRGGKVEIEQGPVGVELIAEVRIRRQDLAPDALDTPEVSRPNDRRGNLPMPELRAG